MKIVFEWDTGHPMEHEIRQLYIWACDEKNVFEKTYVEKRESYRQIEEINQCPAYLWRHPWHGVDNDLAADDKYDVD